jgi:hypothetical protein
MKTLLMRTFDVVDLLLGFVLNVLFLNVHVALDLLLALQLMCVCVCVWSELSHSYARRQVSGRYELSGLVRLLLFDAALDGVHPPLHVGFALGVEKLRRQPAVDGEAKVLPRRRVDRAVRQPHHAA